MGLFELEEANIKIRNFENDQAGAANQEQQDNGNDSAEPLEHHNDSILVTNENDVGEDGVENGEEEQEQQHDGHAVPAEDMNALEDSILVDNNNHTPPVVFDVSHILS